MANTVAKYQKYAEYKDSGFEAFGQIPSHWEVLNLRYVFDFLNEKRFPLSALERAEKKGQYPYYGASGIIDYVDEYVLNEKTILIAEDGANLLSRSTPLAFIADGKYWVNNHAHILKPKNLQFHFWTYFLQSVDFTIYITGSAQPKLSRENLGDVVLLKPSLNEQQVIANFLDHETVQIDTLIAKQEKLIELLKEKRQAVISHAVTKGLNPDVAMKDSGVEWLGKVPEHWEMAPVRRYLLEHRQGYYTTDSYVEEGLKLLRITDLRDLGEINTSNCPMVNESDTTHLFKLRKGDVVFARTGGAGSFGVITEDYENLIYASYLIRFRFMSKIFEPDYLRFLFQSDSFQLSVKQNIHGGVNQNIHAEDIKNTVVCAPSLLEQKKIIEYLDHQCSLFENLINKAIYSVKLMQERRTALISSAVTGKIDVRNWQNPNKNNEAKTEFGA